MFADKIKEKISALNKGRGVSGFAELEEEGGSRENSRMVEIELGEK